MITLQVSSQAGLPVLIYLANLVIASVFVCAMALLAQRFAGGMLLPLRHAILLCALAVTVASPLLVGLFPLAGCSLVGVTAYDAAGPAVETGVAADALIAPLGRQQSAERDETRAKPAGGPSPSAQGDRNPRQDGSLPTGSRRQQSHSGTAPSLTARALWWIGGGLLAAWIVGSGYQLYRLAEGIHQVRRFVRSVEPIRDPRIHRIGSSSAASLGLRKLPRLGQSADVQSPVSLGILRALVVLPGGRSGPWSDEQLRCMIAHEMAHVRRRDALVGLLQRVALVVYWWNPLAHRVSANLALVREEICDDLATREVSNRLDYATLLVELASRVVERRAPGLVLGTADGSPGELTQRVQRLMDAHRPLATSLDARMKSFAAAFAAALLLSLAAMSVHLATARARAPSRQKPTTKRPSRSRWRRCSKRPCKLLTRPASRLPAPRSHPGPFARSLAMVHG